LVDKPKSISPFRHFDRRTRLSNNQTAGTFRLTLPRLSGPRTGSKLTDLEAGGAIVSAGFFLLELKVRKVRVTRWPVDIGEHRCGRYVRPWPQ